MAANTKIQWATHTFNPWRGCTKIAAGCANCYADALSKRSPGTLGVWGPHGTRVVASEAMWREPLKWDREAAKTGEYPRVFCASLADVWEDRDGEVRDSHGNIWHVCKYGHWSPLPSVYARGHACLHCEGLSRVATLDDVRARLAGVWDATSNLIWLVLTKRIENVRLFWPGVTVERDESFDPPKDRAHARRRDNVWLGVSIACRADMRLLDELRKCRDLCAKIFVSAEPLLEDLGTIDLTGVDWVIVGGESGPNARPCNVAWIRSIVRQCRDAGVPCFVKQLGVAAFEWAEIDDRPRPEARDKHFIGLRDKKGGDPAEWPEDLRVREVPS